MILKAANVRKIEIANLERSTLGLSGHGPGVITNNMPTRREETAEAEKTDSDIALSLRAWLRLAKLSRHVERQMARQLRQKYGHGMSRFDVLSQLTRYPDRWISVGELSKQLLAEHAGITRLIDRMIECDFIERRANPRDRRSYQVAITPTGRKLFHQMAADHARWVHDVFGTLGPENCRQLIELLDQVREIAASGELSRHESEK